MTEEATVPERTQAEIAATVKKTEAEADKAAAEAEKARAEALGAAALARKQTAEAEITEVGVEQAHIIMAREQRIRDEELASDEYHHVYRFLGRVDEASVNRCVAKLAVWHRMDPDCAITFIFNSPGGSIIDGMNLYDVILELRGQGHFVTTMTRGWAASMAGILLQAGDVRVMGKEAFVLIHEAAFGAMGKTGEIEDMLELVHQMQSNVLDIFAERAKATGRPKALTRAAFSKRWRRKDWWLAAQDCYDFGIIDEIR